MADSSIKEMLDNGSFLGQGWSFPPTFTRPTGAVLLVKEVEDIKQSLGILLGTALGERVMRSDFGCNLDSRIFDPMEPAFNTLITEIIRRAIIQYEPRVDLDSVDLQVDQLEGRIEIFVNYTILANNTRSNIVFPFYLNEGTNVEQ
jgi:uncharacterized protein